MNHLRRSTFFARALVTLALATAMGGPVLASSAGAVDATHEFYLVLGASESVGVQPTVQAPHGRMTARGYANDVVAMMARDGVAMSLTQLGCPGASTTSMLYGGDQCGSSTSQLTRAVDFLHAHAQDRGVVSIDIGFNDLGPCFRSGGFDPACVDHQIALIAVQLPQIIDALKAAAGPYVTFVGLNHDNPFLASAVHGRATDTYVDNSAVAIDRLNTQLDSIYAGYGIEVANVARAYALSDTTKVTVPDLGAVPTNLARVCSLTWMCRSAPFGPNIHPDNAGYRVMARAIAAVLH